MRAALTGLHRQRERWRVFGLALGREGRILYVAQTAAERAEAKFEVARSGAVLAALAVGILGYFWLSCLAAA